MRNRSCRPWVCSAALLLAAAAPALAAPAEEGAAQLKAARWLEPGPEHVVEPYGEITEVSNATAVTKLPPPEQIHELTMTIELTFDTSAGTRMPLRIDSRSGMLDIRLPPELADNEIAAKAITGTTATIHLKISADPLKLRRLQPVYYEVVSVVTPGRPSRGLAWTFKPYGKHDEQRPVRRAGPTPASP